jgi:hypothetical protein
LQKGVEDEFDSSDEAMVARAVLVIGVTLLSSGPNRDRELPSAAPPVRLEDRYF